MDILLGLVHQCVDAGQDLEHPAGEAHRSGLRKVKEKKEENMRKWCFEVPSFRYKSGPKNTNSKNKALVLEFNDMDTG